MTSHAVLCLGLLVLLALCATGPVAGHKEWLCKDKFESCTPAAGDCCSGTICKKGAAGNWKCLESDFDHLIDERSVCQRKGQFCSPGLNNNCCPGLYCRSKPRQPSLYECW